MIKKILFFSFSIFLCGCMTDINTNLYDMAQVGETMTSYEGILIAKRSVIVSNNDNNKGAFAGGAAGATIGSLIGAGQRNGLLYSLGAATAGALAGSAIQGNMKQEGWEYTIRLKDNSLKTVVQGKDVDLKIGQNVLLHLSNRGRARIVPLG